MKKGTIRWISGISFLSLALAVASPPVLSDDFTLVVPSAKDGGVRSVHELWGADGALNLAYEKAYPERPSEFFHVSYRDGRWGTPRLVPVPHPNGRMLHDVVTLADGMPLLLMSSDDTDYARLLNLGATPTFDQNGAPVGAGISTERLRQVLAENQRLFYSLQVGGNWTPPMPIPDTTLVTQAVLAAGEDGSALAVFLRDGDKRPESVTDIELYAAVYQRHVWSRPVRLTANALAEHTIAARHVNGKYLVVWVTDGDGDLKNRADSTLDYAVVAPDGTVSDRGAVVSEMQDNPVPVLGRDGSDGVLLWTTTLEAGKSDRGVWEARFASGWLFGASWTKPVNTGLRADYLLGGNLQNRAEGLLLTYKDKGMLNVALKANGKWNTPMALRSFSGPLQFEGYRFFADRDNRVWVAAAAGFTDPAEEADPGLYVWQQTLGQDLAVQLTGETPRNKHLGQAATLTWKVVNLGTLPSKGYRAEVIQAGKTEKSWDGAALAPGESQTFEYTSVLNAPQTEFEMRAVAPSDGHQENNALTQVTEILPDFEVRSVRRTDATHFTADIIEKKGIAAAPVKASFYVVENGKQSLVAQGKFDPNSGLPLTVQTNALLDKTTPYQVLVRVNEDRSVKEDDYANDQSAYNFRLQSDFEITQLYFTPEFIHVGVRNSGNQPASSVEVLLTDDPLLGGSVTPGGATPWYLQSLALDASGQGQVDIPRTGRPVLSRESLWAVVNPYGKLLESDRNNNTRKISLTAPAVTGGGTGGGGGGTAFMEPVLDFAKVGPWCSNLQVDVKNAGGAAAIGARVELVNSAGLSTAMQPLPVIVPNAIQSITFEGLKGGVYTLRVVYPISDGSEKSVTRQAGVATDSDLCRNIAGNDVRVDDLSISTLDSVVRATVTVGAVGYALDYRKPLLRVPVEIEVKQGVRTLFSGRQDVYLAGGESGDVTQAIFDVAASALPAGMLQVTARIPVRDDETKASNNLRVMGYSVGE